MNDNEAVKKLEESGIEADKLDELVHEAAASMASKINNHGLEAQISFLMQEGFEVEEIIEGNLENV